MAKGFTNRASRARNGRAAASHTLVLLPSPQRMPPIRRESLEEQAYERLRATIIARRIVPGQRIPLDRFAQDFGISRTPIINALKRLAQERVVEFLARRGIYVRRYDKREMARLFDVREALEGMAARLAAVRISPDDVRRLAALFRGFDGPLTASDVRRYVGRDRHFHRCVVELAGNEHLIAALDSVNMMFFVYQDGLVRPPAETLPEHRAILEGLRRRDPDESESAMRLHIRRSTARLEREAAAEDAVAKPHVNRKEVLGTFGGASSRRE